MRGTCKRWFPDKGYGFIETAEGHKDVFVHFRDLRGMETLAKGMVVEFKLEHGKGGKLRAANVCLPRAAEPSAIGEELFRTQIGTAAKIHPQSPVMDAIVGVAAGYGWIRRA